MAAVETAAKNSTRVKPQGAWQRAWAGLADNPLATYYDLSFRRRHARRHFVLRFMPLIITAVVLITLVGGVLYDLQQGQATRPRDVLLLLLPALLLGSAAYALQGMADALSDALAALGSIGPAALRRRSELDELVHISRLNEHEILLGLLRVLFPRMFAAAAAGCFTAVLLWTTGFDAAYLASGPFSLANLQQSLIALFMLLLCSAPACLALLLYTLALGGRISPSLGFGISRFLTLLALAWVPASYVLRDSYRWLYEYDPYSARDIPNPLLAAAVMGLLFLWLVRSQLTLGARLRPLRALLLFSGPWLLATLLYVLPPLALLLLELLEGYYIDYDAVVQWTQMLGWAGGAMMPINPAAIPDIERLMQVHNQWGYYPYGPVEHITEDWLRLPLLLVLQCALVWLCSRYALANIRRNRRAE